MKNIVVISLLVLSCNVNASDKEDRENRKVAAFCNLDNSIDNITEILEEELKKKADRSRLDEEIAASRKIIFVRKSIAYCLQKKGFEDFEREIIYKSLIKGMSTGMEKEDFEEINNHDYR